MKIRKDIEIEVTLSDILRADFSSSTISELQAMIYQLKAALYAYKDGPEIQLPSKIVKDRSSDYGSTKIGMIRVVREATSLGLKDAKEAVEQGKSIQCYGEGSHEKLHNYLTELQERGLISYTKEDLVKV